MNGPRRDAVPSLTKTKTDRGFELIPFDDIYGNHCSLQQSSLARYTQPGSSAVWLGVGDNRMHLDCDLVKALIGELEAWLETGRFK